MFRSVLNKTTEFSNRFYQYMVPQSSWVYTQDGLQNTLDLGVNLSKIALSITGVAIDSLKVGFSPAVYGIVDGVKCAADLSKAAYYSWNQQESEKQTALQSSKEHIYGAGTKFVEAISGSASTAYAGLKPIITNDCMPILRQAGNIAIDLAAISCIAAVETVKLTASVVKATPGIAKTHLENVTNLVNDLDRRKTMLFSNMESTVYSSINQILQEALTAKPDFKMPGNQTTTSTVRKLALIA